MELNSVQFPFHSTVTNMKLTSPGVPLIETSEYHPPRDARQVTVDALDQAARIVQAVPDGRPKDSYVSAIRAFMKGRYGDTPPQDVTPSIVVWAEELTDVPDRNCSCHISPPCNDCVEHSYTREVLERLKESIKAFRGY